jgi:hypothetical protein
MMNIPADRIALANAALPPDNVNVGGGVVPVNYAVIQYNGAAITAAQVPPPAFLNIVPKVVNKIARKRFAAVAIPPAVPPLLARVNVSVPSVAVMAALLNPQLPPDNILRPLLTQGQWGNALIGLVQDIRAPIRITKESIDSIFEWDRDVLGSQLCVNSYVQAIMDLLELPSGIRLFRDIIIAHHCLPDLPRVRFESTAAKSSASCFRHGSPCNINLEWDRGMSKHIGGEYVYVARNSGVIPPNPNLPLDFIDVTVPPSVVLAHELGHYVYDLIACKSTMDMKQSEIISGVIVDPSVANKVAYEAAIGSFDWGVRNLYPELEYKQILRQIMPNAPSNPAERTFIDLWDKGNFDEMVIILPTANMLRNGGSMYDDGIIVGEALLDIHNGGGNIHKQIIFRKNGANITNTIQVNAAGNLTARSFVCFGHCQSRRFWRAFNGLNAAVPAAGGLSERNQFKNLVATMLGLITVPNPAAGPATIPLSVANNNLPTF